MTQSEMVSKFAQRRNRTKEEVLLTQQVNGFRGEDNLDDLLVYIEGPDAKKSQSDQQNKKTKKKSASECGANANNNTNGSNPSNGNTKKEKIRRSTEGDDGTSAYAALKSGNAAAGGTLSYKHRSTDSLGLSFNEDDRRPFANVGKSTSSDDGFGGSRLYRDDELASGIKNEISMDVLEADASSEGDALVAKRLQMEELKEALERGNTGDIPSSLAAALTTPTADDEQFIPVQHKKQKKNKADQFRSTPATRYGRNPKGRAAGDEHAKRSVTPPARETAASNGRRRRSLDYSRVSYRATSTTEKAPAESGIPNKEPVVAKSDSVDGAVVVGNNSEELADSSKPSYANVAAAHRHFHPPILGDYVTRATTNKQRFNKKRSSNHPGSRDNRTTRDDGGGCASMSGNRQTPRQTSSLNASRSSSPVNIPTAVAMNLANASSPDLKTFSGDSLTSTGQPRRTYATIAADKRHTAITTVAKSGGNPMTENPLTSSSIMEKENPVSDAGPTCENRKAGTGPAADLEEEKRKAQSDSNNSTAPGGISGEIAVPSTIDASARKCVMDTAVNTEPIMTATTTSNVATTNLGDSAFIFEQIPSTSEVRGVIIRKAGDRSSCSGVFDLPEPSTQRKSSKNEQGESKTNPTSACGNNRERRNSCPVQFLDKAGVGFDAKSLTASGLTFVYGDEEEATLDIREALDRSNTISFPQPTTSTVNDCEEKIEEKMQETPVESVGNTPRIRNTVVNSPPNRIPDKVLRDMVDYASKGKQIFILLG